MAKISLAGFKDPVRRPRFIIWVGVLVLFIAGFAVLVLGLVSSRWFCAAACHKVQDDTVIAYEHSSHNNVACLSCHLPVNANPISFIYHKIVAMGELYLTVTNKYELPMNPESELAMNPDPEYMSSERCTQCHSKNRVITPSKGIIIDHEVHEKKEVGCTYCHNRVGHKEDFEPTLAGNKKHQDFMKMTACFRCHSLEKNPKAPGKCSACHPKDFKLKPDNHLVPGFYPKGHAEMARQDNESVAEAKKEAAAAKAEGGEKGGEEGPWKLPPVTTVSYCSTCHVKSFCDNCHGMEIPHPPAFKEPKNPKDPAGHPVVSKAKPAKCEFCHKQSKTYFCDNCHHGTKVNWKFDPKVAWDTQHAKAVVKNGVKGCLAQCHNAKFCEDCHTQRKPLPSSHTDPQWLHGPQQPVSNGTLGSAKASAKHALNAASQPVACEICHGTGGTKAAFCMNCHKSEMPHPKEFTKYHSKTGRDNPAVCANCHTWPELCSNCHHKGATNDQPWTDVQHPKTVYADGTSACFAKCHKKDFCVACHNARKVVPASHNASNWLHRASASTKAEHTTLFTKSPDSCTYCHGEGGTKSPFCMGCHKLEMPHPTGFGPPKGQAPTATNGGTHAADFKAKKLSRDACANCHSADFCNSCHHKEGFKAGSPWLTTHPAQVKAKGAEPCFGCHKETFCSYCHVRVSKQ